MNRTYTLLHSFLVAAPLLAQPGTLDPSFGTAGIKVLQPGAFHDVIHDVIALDDTTSLICGVAQNAGLNALFIGHLLQDGSLDPAFGTSSGYTFVNVGQEAYGYAMALADDGSIYATGLAYPTFAQSVVILAHFSSSGVPDASFGTGGVVQTPIGTLDSEAKGMVVQDDGKIVVGGSVVSDVTFARDILFVRYNTDGTLDTSFNGDGIAVASAYSSEDLLNDIAILADGSIVGAGYADITGFMKTVLARVDASGTFVSAFGGDGVLVPGFSVAQDRAFGILADGQQFLVTGSFMDDPNNDDTYLARFNSDGTLDAGFGTAGIWIIDSDNFEVGLDACRQPNGAYVVAGTSGTPGFGTPRDFLVARCSASGAPDASFGTNGVVVTSIQADFDDANAVTVQPDGKILAAGFTSGFSIGSDNDAAVVRYLGDNANVIGEQSGPFVELGLAPNPATGPYLQMSGTDTALPLVRFFDASGRSVLSARADASGRIDIGGLKAGTYRVHCTDGARTRTTTVVIVR